MFPVLVDYLSNHVMLGLTFLWLVKGCIPPLSNASGTAINNSLKLHVQWKSFRFPEKSLTSRMYPLVLLENSARDLFRNAGEGRWGGGKSAF